MVALFSSKSSKQFRGLIALIFLLTSILGTHWVGFAHSISHSGLSHAYTELSCADQSPEPTHSLASCYLFDALTLAGFMASDTHFSITPIEFSEQLLLASSSHVARVHPELYQSRAPPARIL